jgi:CRISPR system Cascade subunit CasC
MIAENAHLNVEAACQMAHALSTHRATLEMDFFTAVDDLKPGARGQAEMLGALEFCSACFYRYATVHWEQLERNLQGDTALARAVLAAFLRAAVAAVPLGRQHGAAALSPPSFALAVVRERGMPWSLANAFETPVWVPDHDRQGLVARSVAALDEYWHGLAQMYGTAGIVASAACWLSRAEAPHLRPHRVPDLDTLVARVLGALAPAEEGT